MEQFDTTFINRRLIPLLQRMLVDTAAQKTKHLATFFMGGELSQENKQMLTYKYFLGKTEQGVPFSGETQKDDREAFLNYFRKYIQSRSSEPGERAKLFLPQVDKKTGAVLWPEEVKKNVQLLAYDIVQKFERQKTIKKDQVVRTTGGGLPRPVVTAPVGNADLRYPQAQPVAAPDLSFMDTAPMYTEGQLSVADMKTIGVAETGGDLSAQITADIAQIQWQKNVNETTGRDLALQADPSRSVATTSILPVEHAEPLPVATAPAILPQPAAIPHDGAPFAPSTAPIYQEGELKPVAPIKTGSMETGLGIDRIGTIPAQTGYVGTGHVGAGRDLSSPPKTVQGQKEAFAAARKQYRGVPPRDRSRLAPTMPLQKPEISAGPQAQPQRTDISLPAPTMSLQQPAIAAGAQTQPVPKKSIWGKVAVVAAASSGPVIGFSIYNLLS